MVCSSEPPYLSVVATARNDDHGANLLRRLQTFVNALIANAGRHRLPVELVLVEWNPPPEKPALAEALHWPSITGPCAVRIVTVAPEIHARYRHAGALPLYQMIAKNAGIRRAAGEFILATNIDILFSVELMQFFAERRLEPGRMYRIDRHDVETDVPPDAQLDEQLEFCRTHMLRINAREGTFPVTSAGQRILFPADVADAGSGISFGAGWSPPEQRFGQLSRPGAELLEIHVRPAASFRVLALELQAAGRAEALSLTLLDPAGNTLGEVPVDRRSIVRIGVPAGNSLIRLRAAVRPPAGAGRIFTARAFRCGWDSPAAAEPLLSCQPEPAHPITAAARLARGGARLISDLRAGKGTGRVGLPLSPRFLDRLYFENTGVSLLLRPDPALSTLPASAPAALHTNGCGDFTLLHRRHWFDLRGYPEFDAHSMNLDSVFCYSAHYGGAPEHVLGEPMRIYHIEHSAGSGWTPEGQSLLYRRLLEKGLPWIPFDEAQRWAAQMERWGTTMVFNREDWGLGGFDLPETRPAI